MNVLVRRLMLAAIVGGVGTLTACGDDTGGSSGTTGTGAGGGNTTSGPGGGGQGGGGEGGVGAGGEGGCTGVCDPLDAEGFSMLGSELPEIGGAGGGTSSGGGGGPVGDPDAVHIFIGNDGATCGEPYGGGECGAEPTYQVFLTLPTSLQMPGTIALNDPELNAFFSETSADDGGGVCGGGGGSMDEGSVVIVSIDSTEITGYFVDADMVGEQDINEKLFSAPRCPVP